MDLSSLLSSLSEEDMQKLQQTAASFFGGQGSAAPASPQQTAPALPALSPELLGQAAKISAALSQKDPRSDFMLALKPLLSPKRQKKAEEAAMMVRLFAVLAGLKEGGR